MTRTIWLCLRCGWRCRASGHADAAETIAAIDHEEGRCGFNLVARTIDEHGRITGGPRSRQP